jgi:hypothetical protein
MTSFVNPNRLFVKEKLTSTGEASRYSARPEGVKPSEAKHLRSWQVDTEEG